MSILIVVSLSVGRTYFNNEIQQRANRKFPSGGVNGGVY